MPQPAHKRGAQPGNRNACKANRLAKAQSDPATTTPMPANIAALVDLGIEFLTETMLELQKSCRQEFKNMDREEKRQMMKAASYAATAIEKLLRAKMLQQTENQESLSDYINQALDEMNAELEVNIAKQKQDRLSSSPYTPFSFSFGES